MLAGKERYLEGFSYEFWTTNLTGSSSFEGTNVTVRLRFYANDGTNFNGYPTPGTLLYDSGEFWLGTETTPRATVVYDEFDLWLYALYPLMDAMPSSFTWTVQFSGLGAKTGQAWICIRRRSSGRAMGISGCGQTVAGNCGRLRDWLRT